MDDPVAVGNKMNDALAGGGVGLIIGIIFAIIGMVFIIVKQNASTWRKTLGILILVLGCIGVLGSSYAITIGSQEIADDDVHNRVNLITDTFKFKVMAASPISNIQHQCIDTIICTTLKCIQESNTFKFMQNDHTVILPVLNHVSEVVLLTLRCVIYRSTKTHKWYRLTRAAEHLHTFTEDVESFSDADSCFMMQDSNLIELHWDRVTQKITDTYNNVIAISSTRPKTYNSNMMQIRKDKTQRYIKVQASTNDSTRCSSS